MGSLPWLGLIALAFVWRSGRREQDVEDPWLGPSATDRSEFEIRRVTVGFDWTARPRIQAALAELADGADTKSARGLLRVAGGAAEELEAEIGAARYAIFQVRATKQELAEGLFHVEATRLRARFVEETVSEEGHEASAVRARPEEGEGLVVVTLLTARRGDGPWLPARLSRFTVKRALQGAVPDDADDLLAVEVIWSPAEDEDRMSSYELERIYPELLRLDRSSNLGTTDCDYCRVVFPAELGRCPGCGAPVEGGEA